MRELRPAPLTRAFLYKNRDLYTMYVEEEGKPDQIVFSWTDYKPAKARRRSTRALLKNCQLINFDQEQCEIKLGKNNYTLVWDYDVPSHTEILAEGRVVLHSEEGEDW